MSWSPYQTLTRMPSDEELMVAASNGDLAAFEVLIQRYQQAAWRTAYRFLGNTCDAEDVCQEAYLRILQAASRYKPTAKFRTYLFRVVSRLCLDHVRKKRPLCRPSLPEQSDPSASPVEA